MALLSDLADQIYYVFPKAVDGDVVNAHFELLVLSSELFLCQL